MTARKFHDGGTEPTDDPAVVDRFGRGWEPLSGVRTGLWRHAGEQLPWADLVAEHGPVIEWSETR